MKICKLFLGTGNAKQVEQLDTLIQDKGSKITNIWLLLSDKKLCIANDVIQLILRLISEVINIISIKIEKNGLLIKSFSKYAYGMMKVMTMNMLTRLIVRK